METSSILFVLSPIVLAVAALFGLRLAIRFFQNRERPLTLALTHGGFALAGAGLFAAAVLLGPPPARAYLALGLLGLTALGGATLLTFRILNKPPPGALIVIHAGAAVVTVGLIISVVLALRAA